MTVQLIRYKAQAFTESLIMHNFSCPQKTDGIPHVIIITETQNIIISGTGFLFCRVWIWTTSKTKETTCFFLIRMTSSFFCSKFQITMRSRSDK